MRLEEMKAGIRYTHPRLKEGHYVEREANNQILYIYRRAPEGDVCVTTLFINSLDSFALFCLDPNGFTPCRDYFYLSGIEALKAVYEGKRVALDDREWVKKFKELILFESVPCPTTGSWDCALDKKYIDQNKWYVVE